VHQHLDGLKKAKSRGACGRDQGNLKDEVFNDVEGPNQKLQGILPALG
jgi:hypothetical protein